MAATRFLSLSRTLFTTTSAAATTPTKQTLASLISRPFSAATTSTTSASSLLRLRPLASTISLYSSSGLTATSPRRFSTHQAQNSVADNNPNWSNRPPKETILLDGCDFEHWLVVVDNPPENLTRDEIIDSYIKTLAQIIGSEEEARMKIYSVSTKHYFAFGCLVNEELTHKLKELPNVRWVLPDSYLDVKNKDYGGEPFIDGQAVPYDPKYHEEWVRNNAKAQERNRRNDRPRNSDRSRNFDRRQVGPPGQNMPPPNNAGYGQNRPQGNPGYQQQNRGPMPPPNYGGPGGPPGQNIPPPNNAGYGMNTPQGNPGYQQQNMPPHNNAGYGPNTTQGNPGYQQQNRGPMPPPSYGGPGGPPVQNMPPHNNAGYGPNAPQGNPGYRNNMPDPHAGQGVPYENTNQNYSPQNRNMGGQQGPGGGYQQDVPGRDGPNY